MKITKAHFFAVGLLLAALVTALFLLHQGGAEQQGSAGETAAGGQRATPLTGNTAPPASPRAAGTSARERQQAGHAELVAQYGEARTGLSKHTSTNIIGIMDDAIAVAEMTLNGPEDAVNGAFNNALGGLRRELNLSDEQNARAKQVFLAYQRRQTDRAIAAAERLKTDPTPLMRLMLAGDAKSRGEIGDEDYRARQAIASVELDGIVNPLDHKNFNPSPLRDAGFVNGMRNVLDPDQTATLEAAIAKRETERTNNPDLIPETDEGGIATLPGMDIEKLDKSIEASRKVTAGIRSLLDGLGGLREMKEESEGKEASAP